MSNSNSGKRSRENPELTEKSEKKPLLLYSKENFQMYTIWLKYFINSNKLIFDSIGKNLEDYYQKLDKKFFEWLNQPKNNSKFMFEIKKEFLEIANETLLYKIMIEQRKRTEYCFVIGPFQKYLEIIANEDSDIDIDIDIDFYPDIEPNYHLIEEYIEEIEEDIDYILDDEYYSSFFVI